MKTFSVSRRNLYIQFFLWCWDVWVSDWDKAPKTKVNFCQLFWGTIFWPVGVIIFHFHWIFKIISGLGVLYGINILFGLLSEALIGDTLTYLVAAILTGLDLVAIGVIIGAFLGIQKLIGRFRPAKAPATPRLKSKVKAERRANSFITAITALKSKTCPVWEINGTK